MNLDKNYYNILGVKNDADEKTIKKAYYKLSFKYHPDHGGDPIIFAEISESYNVLCGDDKKDYDLKSKYGLNYNEYFELFDINVNFDYKKSKSDLDSFKKNEILDICITVDDTFDGTLVYERWVRCKTCDGTGKDLSAKIVIKDEKGNITKIFDADDGCDFCDGTGQDHNSCVCSFCNGAGKIGLTSCKKCNGNKRIYGKQKLKNIILTGDETKIDAMGHCSRDSTGMVGYLLIKKIK